MCEIIEDHCFTLVSIKLFENSIKSESKSLKLGQMELLKLLLKINMFE